MNQIFKWASIISCLGAGLCIFVIVACEFFQPTHIRLVSFSESYHIGLSARGNLDTRIALYNDSEFGPYQGSVLGLVDKNGNASPVFDREQAFGDWLGVYHRYFREAGTGLEIWTTLISLWYPTVILSIIPIVRISRWYVAGRTTVPNS